MGVKEIRENINEYIDARLEQISYFIKIKDLAHKIETKLSKEKLLGKDSKIKYVRTCLPGDIMIEFNEKFHLPYCSPFYFHNYSSDSPIEIKEIMKPIIVEVFLHKKLYERCRELQIKAIEAHDKYKSEYKCTARIGSKINFIWNTIGYMDCPFEEQLLILEDAKKNLENLSDEELLKTE